MSTFSPFKVIENDDMYNMRDSIKENSVLVPALVRQKKTADMKWFLDREENTLVN